MPVVLVCDLRQGYIQHYEAIYPISEFDAACRRDPPVWRDLDRGAWAISQ